MLVLHILYGPYYVEIGYSNRVAVLSCIYNNLKLSHVPVVEMTEYQASLKGPISKQEK